jgi:hypothetical protein
LLQRKKRARDDSESPSITSETSHHEDDPTVSSTKTEPTRTAKRSKPNRATKQGTTLDALKNVGEGNKALGESLNQATAQEQERIGINREMVKELSTANRAREVRQSQSLRIDASEPIAILPEFETLDESEQNAVQAWLDDDAHSIEVLKPMRPLRGRWLKRKLGDIIQAFEDAQQVSR